MKNDDVQLIHRVLDGDDTAFSALVRKYQRSVHALAWRKIGDFHIAEDITQEAFLKAYQRLSTLKETAILRELAVCHHCQSLQSVASEEADVDSVVGRHKQCAVRKSDLFWTYHCGE